jgi:heptosyltransferase-2
MNILVMRYRFIGDTVLTVPFLRNLRMAYRDAYISMMVAPFSKDVLLGSPYIDNMIIYDPPTIHSDCEGRHKGLIPKLKFIKDLRKIEFNKVYILKRSFSSALIAYLSGVKERIGFDTEGRGYLLTKRVPYRDDIHEVENFLNVLRADSVEIIDKHLELWVSEEEENKADRFLKNNGVDKDDILIGLHPFSAVKERGWHKERFAELVNSMLSEGFKVIIFGGSNDDIAEIYRFIKGGIINFVGKGRIRDTMALIKRCKLFIGNDSGLIHISAALNTPLIALFGPQSPKKFGPWGENCRIIYKDIPCSPCKQKFFKECSPSIHGKPRCIEEISVKEVLKEAYECLNCQ